MKYLLGIIVFVILAGQGICSEVMSEKPQDAKICKWDMPITNASDPNEVIQVKWSSVVGVLEAENIQLPEKEKIIDKILEPIFDYSLMSKLALGKKNWIKLSKEQRAEYTELFIKRLKNSYKDKIASYKNQKSIFKPGVKVKSTFHVPMELVSDDTKMTILYKLRKVDDKWKIYDLEIQGVSILLTYRSQFDDILSHSSVEDFLGQLKKTDKPKS